MNEFDTTDSELQQRLRREAAAWGGSPSEACSSRWRAALEMPSAAVSLAAVSSRRSRLPAAAAAVLLTGLLGWAIARGVSPERQAPEPSPAPQDLAWLSSTWDNPWDSAVGPLEREYAALRCDVGAVADAIRQGMPRPLRSLLGG